VKKSVANTGPSSRAEIATESLSQEDLPAPDASWYEIGRFALTFNGYAASGTLGDCATIANERIHDTMGHLRMCLFFEQRRWRHFGDDPTGDDLAYIRELVEEMRRRLLQGEGPDDEGAG
jgi:hypothetical protein